MMRNDRCLGYKYDEPTYEEVSHENDPWCSVSPERYDMFLRGFHCAIRAAEEFLKGQFEVDETVLCRELDKYREHIIEFTWMDLREEPEWYFIERYRDGVLDAKLLPPKGGDRFYEEIAYSLKNNTGYI